MDAKPQRMRLSGIVRYPVKSLQGESVTHADIDATGLRGDRCWGIRDAATGRVLTARRAPELLFAVAALDTDGTPVISLPTGLTCRGAGPETDAALSDWLGRPVSLVGSIGNPAARAEYFADATDDASEAIEWTMPAGRFVDAMPLLVLTTATLRAAASLHPDGDWDLRRFRANLVLDAPGDEWVEDGWYGRAIIRIGDATLQPEQGCVRCTMVTRPQPGLDEDRDIFRTIARHHGARFGAWTAVLTGAPVAVGDDVWVEPVGSSRDGQLVGHQRHSDEDATRAL